MNRAFAETLPDFSKGERADALSGRSFEPLFPTSSSSQETIQWQGLEPVTQPLTHTDLSLDSIEMPLPELPMEEPLGMDEQFGVDALSEPLTVESELTPPMESEIILGAEDLAESIPGLDGMPEIEMPLDASEPTLDEMPGSELELSQPELAQAEEIGTLDGLGDEAGFGDLNNHHQDQTDELIESHREEVIAQLNNLHLQLVDGVAEKVEAILTKTLAPLVQGKVEQAGIDALVGEVRSIIRKSAIGSMRLTGPAPLAAAVTDALRSVDVKIEFEEAETVDLSAEIDGQLLSTCIENWSKQLKDVIEQC